jgi:hypothetical protein
VLYTIPRTEYGVYFQDRFALIDKRVDLAQMSQMYFFKFLFGEPSPDMAIMDEVQERSFVPLSFELTRQTEIFFEEKLCKFTAPRRD